jgi:hypothetical protein
LIGLPESIDSRTANSRDRSWRIRAIRNRYFARSLPDSVLHDRRNALRAARTALSMSAAVARATSASFSSVAGLTVANTCPSDAATSLPPMNRP